MSNLLLSALGRLFTTFLQQRGFTLGVEDILLTDQVSFMEVHMWICYVGACVLFCKCALRVLYDTVGMKTRSTERTLLLPQCLFGMNIFSNSCKWWLCLSAVQHICLPERHSGSCTCKRSTVSLFSRATIWPVLNCNFKGQTTVVAPVASKRVFGRWGSTRMAKKHYYHYGPTVRTFVSSEHHSW